MKNMGFGLNKTFKKILVSSFAWLLTNVVILGMFYICYFIYPRLGAYYIQSFFVYIYFFIFLYVTNIVVMFVNKLYITLPLLMLFYWSISTSLIGYYPFKSIVIISVLLLNHGILIYLNRKCWNGFN